MRASRAMATVGAMALMTGLAQVAVNADPTPSDGRSHSLGETTPTSTKKVGGRIRIVLTGDIPPTSVRVRVVGVKGKAKGWKTRVTVKKSKVVKRVRKSGRTRKPLPTGTYRIISADTIAAGATFSATRPTVKVVKKKVRKVSVRYSSSGSDQPQSDGPTPPVTPPAPTQPPAPIQPPTPPATPPAPTQPPSPPADAPPGPVTGLQAQVLSDSEVALSWTNPTDSDLAEVIVRRSVGSAPATPSDGDAVPLSGPLATSVTDSGLLYDTAYTYSVFTKDAAGNVTGPVAVTATTDPAKVFATAWSEGNGTPGYQENSADSLIAKIFDKNQSGAMDAGDEIALGSAPKDFAGGRTPLQAGSLPVTGVLSTDASNCVVEPGAGYMQFTRLANQEQWSEGDLSGTSFLIDDLRPAETDAVSLSTQSPSKPADAANVTAPGTGDNDFLEIELNCR